MTCLNRCCHCFVLMGGVSELSDESCFNFGGFWSLVLLRLSKFMSSVESWNADSILSWSENFERQWRKSIISVDYWSYRKFFFYFLDWTRIHQISGSCENRHTIFI